MPEPIATWNSARGVWERPELNMLCGHAVPFSETWPTSFMTLGGRLYPLPTREHRTDANASSSSPGLLPTPEASDGLGGRVSAEMGGQRPSGSKRAIRVATAVAHLLPTPAAGNFNDGEDLESWEARRQRNLAKGINGNGQGTPLAIAAQQLLPTPRASDGPDSTSHACTWSTTDRSLHTLVHTGELGPLLKTPTAQLAVNGGSQHPDKRREGGHGPTLADQVEHQLLPTPAARDWKSGQSNLIGTNARPLNEVVEMLLPTPTARTQDRTPEEAERRHQPGRTMGRNGGASPDLASVAALLPTPMAADGGWTGNADGKGARASSSGYGLRNTSREISRGGSTSPRSAAGKPSSAAQPHVQLSLDGLESD